MSDLSVVLVTAPNLDEAARLVRTLVEERLAACGNLVPGIRSIYQWEGVVRDETEVLVVLKTRREAVPALRDRAAALHPYDCPEIIALSADDVFPPYLAWVLGEVP